MRGFAVVRFTALAVSAFFGAAAAWGELPVGSGAEAATPARALVKLETAGGEPLAGEGFVVFKGAADAAPLVVPTKLPGSAAADLPPGSQWTLIADFPGYFASATVFRVPLDAGGKPIETRMLLRPAGLLTGRLTPGDKDKLPQGLEARFEPAREGPPPKQDVPSGVASCAVSPDVLSPPAGALKSMDVEISPDSAFLLQVEPQGGELVVDVGKEDSLDGKVLALWQGGIGIPVGTLLRWAEGNGVRFLDGGRVRIPRLAAGDYTVCLGIAAVIDPGEIEEWKKSRATCASGYLATASSLHLRLD